MRAQLLRVLQRLPVGGAAADGVQLARAGFSSSAFSSSNTVSLPGSGNNAVTANGFSFKQLGAVPGMGFAAHMSSLRDEDRETRELNALVAQPHMYKVPSALVSLPARSSSLVLSRSATSKAAHGGAAGHAAHAHNEPHYHDHGAVHPYHVLPPSPWPLLASWSTGVACLGMSGWFHNIPGGGPLMAMGIANVAWSATCWWRDCIIESDMGMHTEIVKRNLVSGVWMFIVSEAVLFFGLLWSCIHLGMAPTVHVQMQWPPVGVIPVGWDKRALVMSAVLAASYYSANVAMVAKDPRVAMAGLATTTALGVMFLADQYLEYNELPFTITDSPYGSTFYITTGFHGMHVLLGAMWLGVSLAMYPRYNKPGVGMKGAVLYWHFVDIVWIAVYGIIYVGQY